MGQKSLMLFIGAMLLATGVSAKSMNVVFILADDLGWSDTTLYGTTGLYETPNLERLASRGMTFTRAYSASPLCSPTRASILTGQTPARTGSTAPQHHLNDVRLQASVEPSAPPGDKALQTVSATRLETKLPTLGKLVKGAGYATAHFGKWHLGPEQYSPLEHGFDLDIPHWPGPGPAGSFVAPWKFKEFKENYPGEHIEDRMAAEAVKWMKEVDTEQPFYMNYWQFSVHAPFNAKEDLIERYRAKIDPDDPQRSPTYAAMVHSLDDAVGSLLDAVDQRGLVDQTVIIFISDNGGNMYDEVDGTTPTSNFPLRGGKATMFEGGTRVPCVIVWPGITKPGTRSDQVIQTTDFYPTILNQLGIALPENHPLDGVDITPALQGGKLEREAIYTFFPHSPAVPDWLPPAIGVTCGDWKLLRLFFQGDNGAHAYLLFNLKDDLSEKNNLAAAYPEKVQQLDRMIEGHIKDTHAVVPQPNPAFDPKKFMPENIGLPKNRQKAAGSVAGWVGAGTCTLTQGNGHLIVNSTGQDPYLMAQRFDVVGGGAFKVHLRMKSHSSGAGMFYYNKPAKERTITFPAQHDGAWHEYQVKIPVEQLTALRLDPSTAQGRLELDWIRVEDSSGKTVLQWDF